MMNDLQGNRQLGRIAELRGQGKIEQALKELNRLIETNPDDPALHRVKGQMNRLTGDTTDALLDLTTSIKLDPFNEVSYLERGYIYRDRLDYKRALKDFDTGIAIDPGEAEYHRLKGTIHFDQREYRLASNDYSCALKIEPRHTMDLLSRGRCSSHLGLSQKALEDFNSAIKFDAKMVPAYRALAYEYYQMKNFREAISNINKFLEFVTDDLDVFELRARCFLETGAFKKSLDDCNLLLLQRPGNQNALAVRKQALEKLRELKEQATK